MKRILAVLFLIISNLCLGEMRDIAGKGEYQGFRKLVGHEFEGKYDIYFKVKANNGSISEQIKVIPLHPGVNMQEKITITLSNGEKVVGTREDWYKIFREIDPYSELGKYLDSKYPKLYNEWWESELDTEPERQARKYIERVYYPKLGVEPIKNRFSTFDMKVTVE